MRPFLLLFLLFPVLELFVFVKVSAAIGFFPALLLIILGSMLGVLVLRVAGLATALADEVLPMPISPPINSSLFTSLAECVLEHLHIAGLHPLQLFFWVSLIRFLPCQQLR